LKNLIQLSESKKAEYRSDTNSFRHIPGVQKTGKLKKKAAKKLLDLVTQGQTSHDHIERNKRVLKQHHGFLSRSVESEVLELLQKRHLKPGRTFLKQRKQKPTEPKFLLGDSDSGEE